VALFGQLILLPLIALGLAWAFHLTPVFFIGLILIACCPGGSSSNVFSKLANGDVALSVTLTALSSIITLFTIPVIMSWATQMIGESVGITLPVGNLIKQNLLLMLLPVLLGVWGVYLAEIAAWAGACAFLIVGCYRWMQVVEKRGR
jgi:BASS family bile acid:Na+ symporter